MANTFTYGAANLSGTGRTTLYTVPHTAPSSTDTTAIVHSCTVANTHATDSVSVTIEVYDTSETTYYPVVSTVPVPADSTLVLDGVKVNMEAQDFLCTNSDTAGGHLTVFASILRIDP